MAAPEGRPGEAGPPAPGAARDFGVILAAAGDGTRFGREKALVRLAGRPLVLHCLRLFASIPDVVEIVIAARPKQFAKIKAFLPKWAGEIRKAAAGRKPPRVQVVEGGKRRQESVARGLAALSPASRGVLVHDAARPLISRKDAKKVIRAVREHGAAVLGHLSSDSVKQDANNGDGRKFVACDLPRQSIWLVQTPQGAAADLLRRAHREAVKSGLDATDEAGLLSALGLKVCLVEGSRRNIKITYPEDLPLAEFLMSRKSKVES